MNRLRFAVQAVAVFWFCEAVGPAAAQNCKLEGGYRYESLLSAVWYAEPDKDKCEVKSNTGGCSWYLQFCNNLKVNPCGPNTACEVGSTLHDPQTLGTFKNLTSNGRSSRLRLEDAQRTPPDARLHRLEAWSAFPKQVLACRGNVSEAVAVLERALKLEPESKVIQQELGRLSAKKQREDRAEKAMYRRMFGAQETPRPQTPRPTQGRSWTWLAGGLVAVAALGVAAYRQVAAV
ncbi:uncharacterized protein ISCGN_009409 [Ixodes scapularis]